MAILPGKTIGILGGGQLGRMFAIAARRMGYRVHAFDPTSDCPTGQVADVEVNAAYDDIAAAEKFARDVDVVTFEFENVPAETLAAIQRIRPVHPSPHVLDTCRHRFHEKDFLSRQGFPVTKYRAVRNADELGRALAQLAAPAILKSADYGYDGKGQVRIDRAENLDQAWRTMGRPLGVLEAVVPFDREISVICARTQDGKTVCFEPGENVHVRGILDVTTVPASISAKVRDDAIALATAIAEALDVVGLLAVEMFVVGEKILVNELAPRPHNSGHFSFDACVTSQFEQQLRAVCGLPLGDATLLSQVAMANLLGDLWAEGEPDWSRALIVDPRVKLHLYGKQRALPGRKMGHLTAMAPTAAEARQIVLAARNTIADQE
jgi:5-(carboxyamino)imidazole ribonucleotide synthase